jgi:hypothetical protein
LIAEHPQFAGWLTANAIGFGVALDPAITKGMQSLMGAMFVETQYQPKPALGYAGPDKKSIGSMLRPYVVI